jgi:hypothetical protein
MVSTYFGIFVDPAAQPGTIGAVHRRIDLKAFHVLASPFALVSWTGNTPLNRSLRLFATNLGYELDDQSLVPLLAKRDISMSKPGGKGSWAGGKTERRFVGVAAQSEFDVFSFLGLRFIPPRQRNCFSIWGGGAGGGEAYGKGVGRGSGTGAGEKKVGAA